MELSKREKKLLGVFVLISIIILWALLLFYLPPTEIIDTIGVQNGYILTFFAALLGGTSVLFPFPYYLVVFTLGAGGLNPFLLGIFSGVGLMVGDSTSYLLGYSGREIITGKLATAFNKIHNWALRKPKWVMPSLLFCYGAFAPIPNDIVVIPLGLARYPFIRVVIPLVLGNMVFSTIIAFAGLHGFEWILNYF